MGFAAAGLALAEADTGAGFAAVAFPAGAFAAAGFTAGAFTAGAFAATAFVATGLAALVLTAGAFAVAGFVAEAFAATAFAATGFVATSFAIGFCVVVLAGGFAAIGLAWVTLPFVAIIAAVLGAGLPGADATLVGADAVLGASDGFALALVVSRVGVLAWATIRILLAPGQPASLAVE